jgi:hypothetical protein
VVTQILLIKKIQDPYHRTSEDVKPSSNTKKMEDARFFSIDMYCGMFFDLQYAVAIFPNILTKIA